MASKKQITDAVETLSKVYGKEPGDLRGFYWALGSANYDTILAASEKWVNENKWMPSPSELRELCGKLEADLYAQGESRRIRDHAYMLFDKYREGEITLAEFQKDRATQWVYKQHGIFSGMFAKK